jgi:hypothetical protein
MPSFAQKTKVPIDRSKQEIERVLIRYGATEFAYATKATEAVIGFVLQSRRIRFTLPLPGTEESRFVYTGNGRERARSLVLKDHAQECKRLWRALTLAIKAKLEMVESGIATFDDEFLGYIVMANGETIGERVGPRLEEFLKKGSLPQLPQST